MVARDIRTSLHGRTLGLTDRHHLVVDGRIAHLNPFYQDQIVFMDDFLGDAIDSRYNFQEGTDSATSDFAILADEIGGAARLTTGDSATTTMAGNGVQVDLGELNFKAANGGLSFETRLKCDAILHLSLFIGFTDQVSALEAPWTLTTATYTSNQSDGCGFLFDNAATTDTIRCVGVKANTDASNVDTADAWAAATYKKFRIDVGSDEVARFYIDEALVATIASALTKTVGLSPVITAFSESAASILIDIDYLRVTMDRV